MLGLRSGLPMPGWAAQCRAFMLVALALCGTAWLAQHWPGIHLLPALGASSVLLAALPGSPLSRPWALLAGSSISALFAFAVLQAGLPLYWSAPLATAGALLLMFALRCLHPPGGAMAVWVMLQPGLTLPTLLTAMLPGLLLLLALSSLLRRVSPAEPAGHRTADPLPSQRLQASLTEWQQALAQQDQLLDVAPQQLVQLAASLQQQQLQHTLAQRTVADIMSRDVISLDPEQDGAMAWRMLQQHRVKLLPVVSNGQVLGVVSLVDLLKRLGLHATSWPSALAEGAQSVLSEPVARLMSHPARTVQASQSLADLVPLLSDWGLHQLPVVDDAQQLVGMVTQSDLIAALAYALTQPEGLVRPANGEPHA